MSDAEDWERSSGWVAELNMLAQQVRARALRTCRSAPLKLLSCRRRHMATAAQPSPQHFSCCSEPLVACPRT